MFRKNYESPLTVYQRVEVESAFCGASSDVTNPNKDSGRIEEHSVNTDFIGDFSVNGWDTDPTGSSTK